MEVKNRLLVGVEEDNNRLSEKLENPSCGLPAYVNIFQVIQSKECVHSCLIIYKINKLCKMKAILTEDYPHCKSLLRCLGNTMDMA